jgi:hypothetical protein
MKRLLALVGLIYLVSDGTAIACSGTLPAACLNCEVVSELHARRGKSCIIRSLSLGSNSVTAGRVIEKPRIGKASVWPGPGLGYTAHQAGSDTFVVSFSGLDRTNNPYSIRLRVNVTVTD